MSGRPQAYKYAVIGLIACSMLLYEVLLTRVCALRLYFHFAFVIISNCLLGIGASGSLIALFQDSWRARERSFLRVCCTLYLISLVATYAFLITFPIPEKLNFNEIAGIARFSLFNLVAAVPVFLGGLVVGGILTFNARSVTRLYAVDLIGAGLACLLCPFFLSLVGAGGVQVVVILLGTAGLVFTLRKRAAAVVVGGLVGAVGLWLLPTADERFPVPAKGLDPAQELADVRELRYSAWSTNSRIDLLTQPGPPVVFTRGAAVDLPFAEQMYIAQDAWAGTFITNFSDNPGDLQALRDAMYSAAFRLKPKARVFIIGAGGCHDLWAAKAEGAAHIKAIELNAPIVDIHRDVLPHYSRVLLEDPTVEIVIDEGRSALERDPNEYDVVQMTGIDTWTALTSGAYVLAENYLYTVEALQSMYSHLADGGILQITRMAYAIEALRMVSNIHAALTPLGVDNLSECTIALHTQADQLMAILVKKGRFTPEEVESTRAWAVRNNIGPYYLPGNKASPLAKFFETEDKQKIFDSLPKDVTPTTDDNPYFFNFTKWSKPVESRKYIDDTSQISQGNPFFILSQLALSIVLSVVLIVLPVFKLRRATPAGSSRPGSGRRYLAYFASLGLGFILIEIAAMQKLTLFLGLPVYSLTVTLFSMLVFTGLGSFLFAERLGTRSGRAWLVPVLVAAMVAVIVLLSPWMVKNLIGLPLAARILITIGLLAPLCLLLGIPFAYGVRVLDERNPALIPWAWAVNGCFSVIGSILAVVISMNLGFNAVLWIAALVYLGGFWALRRELAQPVGTASPAAAA